MLLRIASLYDSLLVLDFCGPVSALPFADCGRVSVEATEHSHDEAEHVFERSESAATLTVWWLFGGLLALD